uniref:Anticodon-binding domain-containing protein n=1 Tax=Globisporangium ultimum (strain ATCC 200006 / CBS 805.95 / DAOM BR144) TaxID=431595 RepID=K3X2Q0_GLOUD
MKPNAYSCLLLDISLTAPRPTHGRSSVAHVFNTVDRLTLDDHCVTMRDRDAMEQKRVPIAQVLGGVSAARPDFGSF